MSHKGDFLVRSYDGHSIRQRATDGYVDATAMCRANGKQWNDYWRLDSTSAYLAALSDEAGIPASQLVQVIHARPPAFQGTWVHPDVAVYLAQRLSPTFAVQVSKVGPGAAADGDWHPDRRTSTPPSSE